MRDNILWPAQWREPAAERCGFSAERLSAALTAFERWAARYEIEESRGFLVSRPVASEVVCEIARALAGEADRPEEGDTRRRVGALQ